MLGTFIKAVSEAENRWLDVLEALTESLEHARQSESGELEQRTELQRAQLGLALGALERAEEGTRGFAQQIAEVRKVLERALHAREA